MVYNYQFSVEAVSETEALKKMEALTVLAKKLKEKELTGLAHILQHDPIKTAMAKKFL